MTRARKKLVIIGDVLRLSGQYPYGSLYNYLKDKTKILHAPVLSDDDKFLKLINELFRKKIEGTTTSPSTDERFKVTMGGLRRDFLLNQKTPLSKPLLLEAKQIEKIKELIRSSPTATKAQIAAISGMPLPVVEKAFRQIMQSADNTNQQPDKKIDHDNCFIENNAQRNLSKDQLYAGKLNISTSEFKKTELIECHYCSSKVRRDRLDKHIRKVHSGRDFKKPHPILASKSSSNVTSNWRQAGLLGKDRCW